MANRNGKAAYRERSGMVRALQAEEHSDEQIHRQNPDDQDFPKS
jgi:hypothetical protein